MKARQSWGVGFPLSLLLDLPHQPDLVNSEHLACRFMDRRFSDSDLSGQKLGGHHRLYAPQSAEFLQVEYPSETVAAKARLALVSLAGWSCCLVGAGGVSEGEFVVGVAGNGPSAGVDEAVVVSAEQYAVVEVGEAAVDPMVLVVAVAMDCWHGASWAATVPVSNDKGFSQREWNDSLGAAHIDDVGWADCKYACDIAIASDLFGLFGASRAATIRAL